jgi:hypothetical protein
MMAKFECSLLKTRDHARLLKLYRYTFEIGAISVGENHQNLIGEISVIGISV